MARITFANVQAATAFLSMAEGMEEVQRDNHDAESLLYADALVRLSEACCPAADGTLAVEIDGRDVDYARAVIDNCLDASAEYGDFRNEAVAEFGEDAEDCLFPGEAVVTPDEPRPVGG